MRIGMILDNSGGFFSDPRVLKESRALCEAGYDVGVLCQNIEEADGATESRDSLPNLFEARLPDLPRSMFFARWIGWVFGRPMFRTRWLEPIRTFVQTFRPQVLHCHDLDMACTSLPVADENQLPVVVDLHENMPALRRAAVSARSIPNRLAFNLTFRYWRLRAIERSVLRKCRRIIVVVPEASSRIVKKHGIPEDELVVVSNTEDEKTFDCDGVDPDILARYEHLWAAMYTGGVGPHRGIETAIRAAAIVGKQVPHFRLVVVGVQERSRQILLTAIEKEDARAFVELVDWVPKARLVSYVAASKVCLVPHSDFEHTQTTVPHKLFQYMIMGKPVVVSSCAPLQRIVKEAKAGVVFPADDASALAQCLLDLHQSGDQYLETLGNNGRCAALGSYAWRHDAERLVEMYRKLHAEMV